MPTDEWPEDGWPSRDFHPDARSYLLVESRRRVQEQLAEIGALDVKIAALFTASAVLFTISGLVGDLTLEFSAPAVLTFAAFFASLISWLLLGLAYWTRKVGVGVDPRIFRHHYKRSSEQELRDAALESAVEDFAQNQSTIGSKALWLQRSFFAIAAQLVLVFASVVATSVADGAEPKSQETTVTEEAQSGATGLDGSR